jgi:1-acyl-sn-glycerol-3-phosphate acyltransferase
VTLRAAGKLVWFLFEVVVILFDYIFTAAFAPEKSRRLARAAWLHRACQRHIKIYSCTVSFSGPVPKSGLLVSNHLSYLDILVIAAITPAVFVSKSEIRNWPVIGWLTQLAGTVFIERERRSHVGPINREIESAMADGALVVIFPEGTSTNSDDVLPFRSSLLEPVAGGQQPISICYLHYEFDGGDARNEVCYWGDHTFFPHAVNLLGKKAVRAMVRFGNFQKQTTDRKELAKQLHAEVLKLKNGAHSRT